MKATCIEQYFHAVLFIMLYCTYKVVLTFMSRDEILVRYHSNESYLQYLYIMYMYVLFFVYDPEIMILVIQDWE